jgi:hypothetical protein
MFDDDNVEEQMEALSNQVMATLNVTIKGVNKLLGDPEFSEALKVLFGSMAVASKEIVDIYVEQGFSREEAIRFAVAMVGRGNK